MFKGVLRKVSSSDKDRIFNWRNQDRIRQNMYNNEIIDYSTHEKWFFNILNSESSLYFIYERDSKPLGLVSFNNIDRKNKKSYWAFYSASSTVRGVGTEMEQLALQYAFNTLELNKLCCEVIDFNYPVVKFHQKHGFKIEGIRKQHYLRDGKYYDIYQLAMFKKDYIKLVEHGFKTSLSKSYKWRICIDEVKVQSFAEFSGDYNPIHMSDEVAKKIGFTGRIAHGAILLAEISKIAASTYPGNNPVYLTQKVDYLSPVYLGDELVARATLVNQIGRYCAIKYEFFSGLNTVVTSYSEFLLNE